MAFDYKKEYKELYAPKKGPSVVEVPPMTFVAVRGSGDPNEEDGAYQRAISVLYAISYTLKMSKKGTHQIDGYIDFVVPPLEGFWWQDGVEGADYAHKEAFQWVAVIRLPDFVAREDFDWAVREATKKKKIDCSTAEYLMIDEGLCVQCQVPEAPSDMGSGTQLHWPKSEKKYHVPPIHTQPVTITPDSFKKYHESPIRNQPVTIAPSAGSK